MYCFYVCGDVGCEFVVVDWYEDCMDWVLVLMQDFYCDCVLVGDYVWIVEWVNECEVVFLLDFYCVCVCIVV